MFKRLIASLVCLTFSFSNLQYVHAQDFSVNQLPVPGTMVGESVPFAPLALKGLVVNPQKPLEFQFIVDTGRGPQDTASIKEEANQLVKYFLAGLTIPEGDLWVNLSPYEKDRMVPTALGQTDLGRDLLAQDYILKQLTASLIYPEKDLGKEFWSRVYAKAQQQFGTTNVPVNTFNKVWILPDQAQVFENVNAAYVTKSTLKVMLDEDYLAKQKHQATQASSVSSQIVREIVIPEIEKEVNIGKNFAPLRQIYQALILAKWYKETIQNGLLDAVYTNKKKVAGVNLDDPTVKEQIYERYLKAYKKGAFNYIKEDPTPDGQVVPRKYFSGGIPLIEINLTRDGAMDAVKNDGPLEEVDISLQKSENPVDLGRRRILKSLGAGLALAGIAAVTGGKFAVAQGQSNADVQTITELMRTITDKRLHPTDALAYRGKIIDALYQVGMPDKLNDDLYSLFFKAIDVQDTGFGDLNFMRDSEISDTETEISQRGRVQSYAIMTLRKFQPRNVPRKGTDVEKEHFLVEELKHDGVVVKASFSKLNLNADALMDELVAKGYIDKDGTVQFKFLTIGNRSNYEAMQLDPESYGGTVNKDDFKLISLLDVHEDVFDWLMQNGYFMENSGVEAHPKHITNDLKRRLEIKFPYRAWEILDILQQPQKEKIYTILENSRERINQVDTMPFYGGNNLVAGYNARSHYLIQALGNIGPAVEDDTVSLLIKQLNRYELTPPFGQSVQLTARSKLAGEALKKILGSPKNQAMSQPQAKQTQVTDWVVARVETKNDFDGYVWADYYNASGQIIDTERLGLRQEALHAKYTYKIGDNVRDLVMPQPQKSNAAMTVDQVAQTTINQFFEDHQTRVFGKKASIKVSVSEHNDRETLQRNDNEYSLTLPLGKINVNAIVIQFQFEPGLGMSLDVRKDLEKRLRAAFKENNIETSDAAMLIPFTVNWYIKRLASNDDTIVISAADKLGAKGGIEALAALELKLKEIPSTLTSSPTYEDHYGIGSATSILDAGGEKYNNPVYMRIEQAIDSIKTRINRTVARFSEEEEKGNDTMWQGTDWVYYNSAGQVIGRSPKGRFDSSHNWFSEGPTWKVGDVIKKSDSAMFQSQVVSKANPAETGGIDLNQINVKRNGKTVNVQFDPAQLRALEQGGFEGFTPVIINITPISSPFQLLGIAPPKQTVLAKV